MRIDPHVHCRDGRECHKETIAHVFKLCDAQGVDMIFDMPNTDPPILTFSDVEERLKLVPAMARGRYRLYIGATADERQLVRAAEAAKGIPEIAGLKLYAGESVGQLAVVEEAAQKRVYEILADIGYEGVLAVHCEKNSLFAGTFDPSSCESHSRSRPLQAETASISDQIAFAISAGFGGVLHICHISAGASVELARAAGSRLKITCGVTPHHLLWNSAYYGRPDWLLYKVNPPLRDRESMLSLRECLKRGEIDWIETDHAPHALSEKLYPPYSSGFPSLCLYRHLLEEVLPSWGIDEETIDRLTGTNIESVFDRTRILRLNNEQNSDLLSRNSNK